MTTPAGRTVPDHNGTPIGVGSVVRQRNVYDSAGGALLVNARQTGVVTAVYATRVDVDFQRASFHGFRPTRHPAPPIRIRADYVVAVPDEEAKATG